MELNETEQAAQKYIVWLLSRREYSKKQILEKLRKRFPDEKLAHIADLAEKNGYTSDQRFTECYVRDKALISGWGKQKIQFEIFRKGITSELFEVVYEDVLETEEILNAAKKQAADKWKNLCIKAKQKEWTFWDAKNKLTAFMASRGHEFNLIKQVLEEVCEEF